MDKRFCIFDMDGPWWTPCAIGKTWALTIWGPRHPPEEALLRAMESMTMLEGAACFMDAFGIPGPPQRIVDEMEAIMDVRYRKDVDLKPGAKEYLERLRGRGCRLCVATATAEPLSRACLSRLGVDGLFDFILSCETLGVSKEHPDVYLSAARRLGAQPAETAVFEDALYAARTARDAGFTPWLFQSPLTPQTGLRSPPWPTRLFWIGGAPYDGNTASVPGRPPRVGGLPCPSLCPGHRRRHPAAGAVPVVSAAGLPVPFRLRTGLCLRSNQGPGTRS